MSKFLKSFVFIVILLSAGAVETRGQEHAAILDVLEFRDMDINDCLKLFSSKTGLNIVAGKSISGKVTVFLKNVEVHDALTIILKSNDLAYIEDRGVIQIVTSADYEQLMGHKFGALTEHEVIVLRSAKASDAVLFLSQLKSSSGKILADEESNSVIIEDVPEKVALLKSYIKTIDVPMVSKVYELRYAAADIVSSKLKEMTTTKMGSIKIDLASNKIFIKDTQENIDAMDSFIKQVDIPLQTKVFKISYAKAEDLSKTILPMLTKDTGTLQFDPRSNTLVLTDIPPKIKEISTIIKALDKNEKEVLIEARIVQIDLTDAYQMGINWEKIIPNAQHTVVSLQNDFSLPSVSPVSTAIIGTLDRDGYSAVVQMIATLGKSRLLSNPRIAVVNNQEARILVGTTTPYVTNSVTTPATGPTTTAESVSFIDTGVKLHVTPNIHDDGYVTMKIKPEVSSTPKSIVTSQKNEIPIVDTSEVETVIRVKDGVTIIIGGLIKDEVKNSKNKIPLLGDIPLIGKAFRNETRSSKKTEIVIFLTPHIISGDVHQDPDYNEPETIKANKTYTNFLPFKDDQTVPVP